MKQGRYINSAGTEHWYINGELHREDGPAVIFPDGRGFWYLNGKLHREDGPAITFSTGTEYWFLNGKEVDPMIVLIQEVEALDETR
jgi:hypothetical protein